MTKKDPKLRRRELREILPKMCLHPPPFTNPGCVKDLRTDGDECSEERSPECLALGVGVEAMSGNALYVIGESIGFYLQDNRKQLNDDK